MGTCMCEVCNCAASTSNKITLSAFDAGLIMGIVFFIGLTGIIILVKMTK